MRAPAERVAAGLEHAGGPHLAADARESLLAGLQVPEHNSTSITHPVGGAMSGFAFRIPVSRGKEGPDRRTCRARAVISDHLISGARRCALAGCALLFALPASLMASAGAATPSEGALSRDSGHVSWHGPLFVAASSEPSGCFDEAGRPRPTPPTTGPEACDLFTLHVDIDPATWVDRPGGVLVRVEMGPADDFDFYIFERNDDGTRGAFVDWAHDLVNATETGFIDSASGDYFVAVVGNAELAGTYRATAEVVSADVTVGREGRDVSSYLHDVSEPDPAITLAGAIVEQHRIPVTDGVQLDTWVLRPDPKQIQGPLPVVLTVTPYHRRGGNPFDYLELARLFAEQLVPRGYAFGIVSLRGTGNSGGCWTQSGRSEATDIAAVIEYYAGLPWSNGKVGAVGLSADGTTAQDVWVEAPPSLATIVPIAPISDRYKFGFVNGVPIVFHGSAGPAFEWAGNGLGAVGLSDPEHVPRAIAEEACPEQVSVQEGGASSAVDGNKDGYWQERDFLAELTAAPERKRASVFYVHGLTDVNVRPHHMEDWLTAIQETGVPFHAWLGQWEHALPDRRDWWQVMAAWLDQFLKERDTGILDAPAVQVKTDLGNQVGSHVGRWRHEAQWPPSTPEQLFLHPHADGTLSTAQGAGTASYYDYNGRLLNGRLPSAEEQKLIGRPDRVMFVSQPLAEQRLFAGLPRFTGTVTATGHRASLILTLLEITPDGETRALNSAALSLNHAADLSHGRDSVAGLPQRVEVDFYPQDDLVRAGSRLALVAAGNVVTDEPGPWLQPVADGSTITLDLADAQLSLPVDTTVTYERPRVSERSGRGRAGR